MAEEELTWSSVGINQYIREAWDYWSHGLNISTANELYYNTFHDISAEQFADFFEVPLDERIVFRQNVVEIFHDGEWVACNGEYLRPDGDLYRQYRLRLVVHTDYGSDDDEEIADLYFYMNIEKPEYTWEQYAYIKITRDGTTVFEGRPEYGTEVTLERGDVITVLQDPDSSESPYFSSIYREDGLSYQDNVTSFTFESAGKYHLSITLPGWSFEDEYCRWTAETSTDDVWVHIAPRPIEELKIGVQMEEPLVYTGEPITPLENISLTLSDDSLLYAFHGYYTDNREKYVDGFEPFCVTNAGTYQLLLTAPHSTVIAVEKNYEQRTSECWWPLPYRKLPDGEYHSNPDMYNIAVNYTGTTYVAYTVLPRPVSAEQAQFSVGELHCDGTPKTCDIVITNDYTGAVLQEDIDYEVSYSDNILAGIATATVKFKGNYTGTFTHQFEILPSNNIADVLGLDKVWRAGGEAPWFAEWYDNAHDGVSCMRSGKILDGQESWIETVVTNSGIVSFWWKASSEASKKSIMDKVVFTVDGEIPETVQPIGGETDWTNVLVAVEGEGPHTLRWTYVKDASTSKGEDCAWLDDVRYLREVRISFQHWRVRYRHSSGSVCCRGRL